MTTILTFFIQPETTKISFQISIEFHPNVSSEPVNNVATNNRVGRGD